MAERKTIEGKVKLTEAGSAALAAWAKRSGVGLADLAEAMGTNQMVPSRAMKRQGWLTLEQAGRLVAFAGGELTAEMLVGLERAPAVPTFPARARAAPLPAGGRPVAAALEANSPGAPPASGEEDDGPPSIEELRRLGRKGLRRLEVVVDNNDSAATAAAEAAYRLVKNWIAAEALEREKDKVAAVKEVDLLHKFNTLLYNAERQADEAEKAAAKPEATAAVEKAG